MSQKRKGFIPPSARKNNLSNNENIFNKVVNHDQKENLENDQDLTNSKEELNNDNQIKLKCQDAPFTNILSKYTLQKLHKEYQLVQETENSIVLNSELEKVTILQKLKPNTSYDQLLIKESYLSKTKEDALFWIQGVIRNGLSLHHRDFTGESREKELFGNLEYSIENNKSIETMYDNRESINKNNVASSEDKEEIHIYILSDMFTSPETLALLITSESASKTFDTLIGNEIGLKTIQILPRYSFNRGKFVVNSQSNERNAFKQKGSNILALYAESDSIIKYGLSKKFSTCNHIITCEKSLNLLKRKRSEFDLETNKRKKIEQAIIKTTSIDFDKKSKQILNESNNLNSIQSPNLNPKETQTATTIKCNLPINTEEYSSQLCAIHHSELMEKFKSTRMELASSSQTTFEYKPLPENYAPCVYFIQSEKIFISLNFDLSMYRSKSYCELRAPLQNYSLIKKKKQQQVDHHQRIRNFIKNSQNASASVLQLQMQQESRKKIENLLSSGSKKLDSYELSNTISKFVSQLDSNPELGKNLSQNATLEILIEENEFEKEDE